MLLHGRGDDLSRFAAAVDAAAAGEPSVLFLEGEAGIGKTALCSALRGVAQARGLRTLMARCSPLERSDAFSAARQLLEPVVVAARADDPSLLDGAAAHAAAVLDPGAGADAGDETRSLHGLYWLVANLADRGPLLLIVDDAHWADLPSLRFLAYLLRRAAGLPLLIALAARPDPAAEARALLDLIGQDPLVVPVRPRPLDEAAVRTVVEQSFGAEPDAAFVTAARDVTGGNPFYLRELLRAAAEAGLADCAGAADELAALGPDRVARAVRLRVEEHGTVAAELAQALAVLDGPSSPGLVAAVMGRNEGEVTAAATQLIGADVLEASDRLTFVHRIVRTAVSDALPLDQRLHLHVRAASALAGAEPGRVAMHLLELPPDTLVDAVDVPAVLLAAAAAARGRGAPDLAIAHLTRALAETLDPVMRTSVLLDLARVRMGFLHPDAPGDFLAAADLAVDPETRGDLVAELVQNLTFNAQFDAAVAIIRRELPSAGLTARARTVLEAELTVCLALDLSQHEELRERMTDLFSRRETLPSLELGALGVALVMTGRDVAAGSALCLRALADPAVQSVPSGLVNGIVFALVRTDAHGHLDGLFAGAEAEARATGAPRGVLFVSTIRGLLRHARGDLLRAEEDVRTGLETAAEVEGLLSLPILLVPAALVLVERGDAAEATRLLAEHAPPEPWPPLLMHTMLLHARAVVAEADGRPQDARADLDRIARLVEGAELSPEALPWRATAVSVLLATGDPVAARTLADTDLRLALRAGVRRAIARAQTVVALCAASPSERAAGLQAALDGLDGDGPSLESLRIHAELGIALRQAGERIRAREVLRDALDVLATVGASRIADRARAELVAAGARPQRERTTGPDALTASERRVVDLAASGSTNREIAQSLFLTTKTVETHLSSCFRKLGVSSRRDLAGALA